MTKTPDPSYWGNPPQTPQSSHQQHPHAVPPYATPQAPPPNQDPVIPAPTYAPQQQPMPPAPQPPKKSSKKIIGIVIAIVLVVLLCLSIGGCAAYNALRSMTASSTEYSLQLPESPSIPNDPSASLSNESLRLAFGLSGNASLTTEELNTIQSDWFSSESKLPDDDGEYDQGVYFVGSDIPAGSYWFEGHNKKISYFYLLQPSSTTEGAYDVVHVNSYYGHNLMDVKDGEVLILINDEDMMPLSAIDETFSSPYQSGVYRVGIDIPAGTYQLKLGPTDDYSACYVMKDLNFTDDSYLFEGYYIEGDQPDEIVLEEGTYVELYNMCMTSLAA